MLIHTWNLLLLMIYSIYIFFIILNILYVTLPPPQKKKTNKMDTLKSVHTHIFQLYRVAQKNPGTVDLLGLCSDQQLSFFHLAG